MSPFWLHGNGLKKFDGSSLFGIGSGHDLEGRHVVAAAAGAASIAHDGAQFVEQGREAVYRCAILERVASGFVLRGG